VWILMVGAALLAATLTLAADRMLLARREASAPPTPTATPPSPTATPRPRVDVFVEAAVPSPSPSPLPSDQRDQVVRALQHAADTQRSTGLILTADRHVDLATEALLQNDASQADRELAAAKAALDEAFRLAPEDLKPQITNERFQIGRMRADLEVNPRDLDQKLRRMRHRLLLLTRVQD
jgi:hypothetical protein